MAHTMTWPDFMGQCPWGRSEEANQESGL